MKRTGPIKTVKPTAHRNHSKQRFKTHVFKLFAQVDEATHEEVKRFVKTEWKGPVDGGNPTTAEFIRDAIREKIEREKAKGPQ